jgi:hypothetical protein
MYNLEHVSNGTQVSTVVDTVTDGSYRFSRLYLFTDDDEALALFDREVKTIYEIYGKAQ